MMTTAVERIKAQATVAAKAVAEYDAGIVEFDRKIEGLRSLRMAAKARVDALDEALAAIEAETETPLIAPAPAPQRAGRGEVQRDVFRAVLGSSPPEGWTVDEIAAKVGKSAGQVGKVLKALMLSGSVTQMPGERWQANSRLPGASEESEAPF